MGWRDRASPVAQAGGWRSRARPVTSAPPATPPAPTSSAEGAALRGFGQGLTAEFGDELGAGFQAHLQRVANLAPEGSLEWAGISNDAPQDPREVYRQAREENRRQLAADREQHGGAAMLGNVGGGVVTSLIAPGAGTYGQAVGLGAATGLGMSEADLLEGDVGGAAADTALGAGLGAAGKYAGDRLIAGAGRALSPVRDWVLRKAGAGQAAAAELADAQAKALVEKNVQSLRGSAGGAASRASNLISNIEQIDIPAENVRRTVGEARAMLSEQLAAVDEALEVAVNRARAMGVDPDAVAPGRQGAFLSPGSKMDAAQKAARSVQSIRAAREKLASDANALSGLPDDEILPDMAAGLRDRQAALRADPRYEDLKQNVLKNSLDDFGSASADAIANREVYRRALASQDEDAAAMAKRLLSGEEAKEQAKQRLQRYGAPLAGTVLGGGAGFGVGLLSGGDAKEAAVLGLAGAGARPALRSIQNLVKQPAVQNAAWSTLERFARTAPQSFGQYAGAVTQALARGPDALKALDKVLRDTSPEYRRRREQQEKAAQGQQ